MINECFAPQHDRRSLTCPQAPLTLWSAWRTSLSPVEKVTWVKDQLTGLTIMSSGVAMLWGPSVPEEMTICPISAHRSSVYDTEGVCVHIKHTPCTYDHNEYWSKKYRAVNTLQISLVSVISACLNYYFFFLSYFASYWCRRVNKENIIKIIENNVTALHHRMCKGCVKIVRDLCICVCLMGDPWQPGLKYNHVWIDKTISQTAKW